MFKRSAETLLKLLQSKPVVDLHRMQAALKASRVTVFRYLKRIPYRRSYNHNGRYYTLHDPTRYDRLGIFSHGDKHFSRDGTLGATVRRLVHESEVGWTQKELQEKLRVRVQSFLLNGVRAHVIARKNVNGLYVYLHTDRAIQKAQLKHHQKRIETQQAAEFAIAAEVSESVVIQVLLTLIRHPGSQPANVVRYLRGHSPPISFKQVRAVFTRYELGGKKGASRS